MARVHKLVSNGVAEAALLSFDLAVHRPVALCRRGTNWLRQHTAAHVRDKWNDIGTGKLLSNAHRVVVDHEDDKLVGHVVYM